MSESVGVFARLRNRLRGDRYMVDADKPARVAPEPAPAVAPVAAAAPAQDPPSTPQP
jgi:hypothetical protein